MPFLHVVGYVNQDLADVSQSTYYTIPCFLGLNNTTADTFRLGDLKPDANFDTWNNDYVATIDLYGAQDAYYTFDQGEGKWYEADEGGMVSGDVADDVELPINQAIIIYSANGAALTYSGSVMAGDTDLYSEEQATAYTGNFTPATITLGDIVPNADFDTWNNDYLATVDLYGAQEDYYTYDQGAGNWYVADEGGMVVGDIANLVEMPANKGFIVYTASGSAKLNIPSPIK